MDGYISLKAAIEAIMSEPTDAHYPSWYADKIEQISVADVAPVRHGRWITKKAATGKEYTICSVCDFAVYYTMAGVLTPLDIRNAKYCPNCGAKMDAE